MKEQFTIKGKWKMKMKKSFQFVETLLFKIGYWLGIFAIISNICKYYL